MLNIEEPDQLLTYLHHKKHLGALEQARVTLLEGGVSNRTVLLERAKGSWVLKQALTKLRVKADWFSRPERVHREAEGLRWLAQLAPGSSPKLVFEDFNEHLLAMEAVPFPHANWKHLLLAGQIEPDHIRQFALLLATIQEKAYRRKEELASSFADRSFFESLRLEPYYSFTADKVPESASFLQALITETRLQKLSLVHGDYSPKNILIYRGKLVLLDHEVIHWGDPAFDIGFALTHLLSKAHFLEAHREEFLLAATYFWQHYHQALDVPWFKGLEERAVRHTLACLLARVAGRSPLEYLTLAHQHVQRELVNEIISQAPTRMKELTKQFAEGLNYANP